MKILFVTDLHLRSASDRPKWRIDNHYVVQFEELNEISNIAKLNNVDIILGGGDTLHHPDASHALVSDIMNWSKTLSCSFYTVVGNHCCFGYRTNDLKSSGLGVLFESGALNRLDELIFEKEKIVIRGIHTNLDPRVGNYVFDEKYDSYKKYIISHNFIIPQDVIFDAIKPCDMKTNAHIVFLGHYHQAFDVTEGTTRFINPGSLSRWSVNEQHQPQILILDTLTDNITCIPLKCSLPAKDIFDMKSVGELKSTEMNLKNFIDSLENTQFNTIDVEQLVLAEGKKQCIDQGILDVVLEKVQLAKQELG